MSKRGKLPVSVLVFRFLGVLGIVVILSGFGVYSWLKSYLKSDGFRIFIENSLGGVLGGNVEFSPFLWEGMMVSSSTCDVTGEGLLRNATARGVQAQLSFSGFNKRVWEVSNLRIQELVFQLEHVKSLSSQETSDDLANVSPKKSGMFHFLPDKAELLSSEVRDLTMYFKNESGTLAITHTQMQMKQLEVKENYSINLQGGMLESSWFPVDLNIQKAKIKINHGDFYLNYSEINLYKEGVLKLEGSLNKKGKFIFQGDLNKVKSEELLSKDWKKKLTGDVRCKFTVSSLGDGVESEGKIELKHGVLTGLPVLDRIAAYANLERFRRLILSDAKLKFSKKGKVLRLTQIKLSSYSLIRVEGYLTVKNRQLDGVFQIGITPGTLSHIPGAETKVFLPGKDGLLWAPLHLTGTMDHPKEDLSNRMIQAAGERMFEMVPETGMKVLKFAHDTATELPEKTLKTGVETLKKGSDIINDGVKDVFDLLPGR